MNVIELSASAPCSAPRFSDRAGRYQRHSRIDLGDRTWPDRDRATVPTWCSVDLRDGNQALPVPMDHERRLAMYALLIDIGYKEIEVGFPAASQADYDFVRHIIEADLIPDDVMIQVITQARDELIERTFASIAGADRAIVHLYNSVSPLHREVVFRAERQDIVDLAVGATRTIRDLAERTPTAVRYEYTPESFSQTEVDFSLEICERVTAAWEPTPDAPIILNLPATVEAAPPNVFADQVEWMHRNLTLRDRTVLSLHPHNDRGTAIAAAELGYQAGADRIEGCLFGNGERTGNVCLVTLGMNLFSQGVDPRIDFSDIDSIKRTVEHCNMLPVHSRHPWAGEYVYTAFSGGHQDAINKGIAAMSADSAAAGGTRPEPTWRVPYLPIDPADVGRTYEAVIRLNSQSGKGGVAYVMKSEYDLDLPRSLQSEFSRVVQRHADVSGGEIEPTWLWEIFVEEYLQAAVPSELLRLETNTSEGGVTVGVVLQLAGDLHMLSGSGESELTALVAALDGMDELRITCHATHSVDSGGMPPKVAYLECVLGDESYWGVGWDATAVRAVLRALASSVGRAERAGHAVPARHRHRGTGA